jgi:hypothetical protein
LSTAEFAVPDAIEPITGWRYWRVSSNGRLASLTGPHPRWSPGKPMRARCRYLDADPDDTRYQLIGYYDRDPHRAPGEACTCGIYATRTLDRLRGHPFLGLRRGVVGEVALWGKVIPGTNGYRAESAYPKRLMVFERTARTNHTLMDELASYGVSVEVVPDRHGRFSLFRAITNLFRRP